jgi:hypothetical protein
MPNCAQSTTGPHHSDDERTMNKKPHLKKSPPARQLDRACGTPSPQLVYVTHARVRTAHTAHVSTESRNQASSSDMVRSADCVATCSPRRNSPRHWRTGEVTQLGCHPSGRKCAPETSFARLSKRTLAKNRTIKNSREKTARGPHSRGCLRAARQGVSLRPGPPIPCLAV